jgi:glycyl-tRNA synthetase beta chain
VPDFLLELFSEEIPARMQPGAAAQLHDRFQAVLAECGLEAANIETHATPRRLALIARGLPAGSAASTEERRGPRADAPPAAVEGFLRSTGLSREALEERDGPKGRFFFAILDRPGQPAGELLAERLPAMLAGFDWPKSMRWGPASASTASPRWVRPLRGIVALLDEAVVDFDALGLRSGRETVGHRFMGGGGPIRIDSAASYAAQLRAAHVILSAEERRAIIRIGAEQAAAAAGLALRPDEGLELENAGLTEWPVPLLGRFDPAFLDVPPEIIQLTMRTNQKYFALSQSPPARGSDSPQASGGGVPLADEALSAEHPPLAPAFICIANLQSPDAGAAIVAGNERVLSARLADARFFWEQDKKISLETHAEKLKDIVFHEKLGTMADKVERVARLARWLVESGAVKPPTTASALVIPDLIRDPASSYSGSQGSGTPGQARGDAVAEFADTVERAARLAKADLTTGTVGEFPELQGVIGGYLAEVQGERPWVVEALKQHYTPMPQGCVSRAVALADRLDTLLSFAAVGEQPTGSRDPYALRRSALSSIGIIVNGQLRISLRRIPAFYWPSLAEAVARVAYPSLEGSWVWQDWMESQISEFPMFRNELGIITRKNAHGGHVYFSDEIIRELEPIHGAYESLPKATALVFLFLVDRLKFQQREAGVRHDMIDAVFALGGEDDLVRLLARVKALQAFVETEDGANLLAGYRRAANILRIEEKKDECTSNPTVDSTLLAEPAEQALDRALAEVSDSVRTAVAAEDFEAAMRALATLRPHVDRFFDEVTVNAPDPALRANRLALLAKLRETAHLVADFSKIEG